MVIEDVTIVNHCMNDLWLFFVSKGSLPALLLSVRAGMRWILRELKGFRWWNVGCIYSMKSAFGCGVLPRAGYLFVFAGLYSSSE